MRRTVFRLLDEYSCIGEGAELFTGGLADIEKRFVTALNSAVRLVYLSSLRNPEKKQITLSMPHILMELCDFSLSESEIAKNIVIPENSESVSFDFCGRGELGFYDASGEPIKTYSLESGYGIFEVFKCHVPAGTSEISLCTDSFLRTKKLRAYSADGAFSDCPEELLPDGKRLFCRLPEGIELCSVKGTKYGHETEFPSDLFEFCGGVFSCEEKYSGEYTVEYYKYPAFFCETDTDETPVPLSPAAFSAAAYAAAAELCPREDGELYSRLTYKYRELLANLYPAENLKTKNSFFAGGLFGRRKKVHGFRG